MSTVFEKDIDPQDADILSSLEDEFFEDGNGDNSNYEYPPNMYKLSLEYSSESMYTSLKEGDVLEADSYVIINTRYGKDVALVLGPVQKPIGVKPQDIVAIERVASKEDVEKIAQLKEKEAEAFKVFREKVAIHKLDMKLITTHYLFDEPKILFFFSSDNRVDFRNLVKDLVSIFKMRIELRQIGVRDESRIVGGLGVCGRAFCCNAVSDKLKPVSIRMAKEQNLSLNSTKISGQCGRLLCCLSYESDCYTECRKKLPQEGAIIYFEGQQCRVIEVNPLAGLVRIDADDSRIVSVAKKDLSFIDGRWIAKAKN